MTAGIAFQEQTGSRDRILDVAESLFARRGFSGVGLREVAEQVGLGKSSLFHHFPGKVELYLAVLTRALARIDERVSVALVAGGGAAARLDGWIDALIDALVDNPPSARLLLRALFEDESLPAGAERLVEYQSNEQLLQRILGDLRQLLRDGVAAGEFRSVSAAHTIQTIIGATAYHFASGEFGAELIGRPLLDPDAVARRRREVKTLLHRGIAADPSDREDGGKP